MPPINYVLTLEPSLSFNNSLGTEGTGTAGPYTGMYLEQPLTSALVLRNYDTNVFISSILAGIPICTDGYHPSTWVADGGLSGAQARPVVFIIGVYSNVLATCFGNFFMGSFLNPGDFVFNFTGYDMNYLDNTLTNWTTVPDGLALPVLDANSFNLSVEPSCFNENTKILCLENSEEVYKPVQDIRKGDLVKSYKHGYRKVLKIGKGFMKNNPKGYHNECMYLLPKSDTVIEDLILTGGHSLLVDNLIKSEKGILEEIFDDDGNIPKIDNKHLLLAAVSHLFTQLKDTNTYIYYQFILENDGDRDLRFGVYANGVLVETPSENQFDMHHYILL